MGGAIGIAGLGALQLGYYFHLSEFPPGGSRYLSHGRCSQNSHDFIAKAEQKGLRNVPRNPVVQKVYHDLIQTHAQSYEVAFFASAAVALRGAVACFILGPRAATHPRQADLQSTLQGVTNASTTPARTRALPPEVLER